MSSSESPENESATAKWLRNPVVLSLAVISTIAGAFRIAGVGSILIANLLLILGVGVLIPVEVGCSKWIRKTGRYAVPIIIASTFFSGAVVFLLSRTITSLRQQTTTNTTTAPVQSASKPNPSPSPNPAAHLGPLLRVTRYDLVPYRVGEPLKIKMFVENTGSSSITLFGGSHSVFVEKLPTEYEERRKLEKRLWAETEKYSSAKDRPLKFQMLTTFAELMSEQPLSQQRIDQLGSGAVMYLMTILKDGSGRTVITSCIHTDPSGTSVLFCVDHNTP